MNLAPQHIEAQPAPSGGRKVGEIWREGATWYEQAVSDTNKPWVLPVIEIEDQVFGVRVVCGELRLPHLAGDASAEQIRARAAQDSGGQAVKTHLLMTRSFLCARRPRWDGTVEPEERRPIIPLEKMPARRQRPGALTLLIWFSACALMAYGLVTLALLVLGGR